MRDALRAYVLARRWHLWAYQAMSAAFTPQYQSGSRLPPLIRDGLLAPLVERMLLRDRCEYIREASGGSVEAELVQLCDPLLSPRSVALRCRRL